MIKSKSSIKTGTKHIAIKSKDKIGLIRQSKKYQKRDFFENEHSNFLSENEGYIN